MVFYTNFDLEVAVNHIVISIIFLLVVKPFVGDLSRVDNDSLDWLQSPLQTLKVEWCR